MFYYLLKRIFEATGTKIVDHRLPFQQGGGESSSYVNLRVHFCSSDSHEWTDKLQKKKSAVSNGNVSLLS